MSENQESEVSWGTIVKGAAIAAAAVAVVALFPASLGAVGSFIAANPLLTIGAAAVAGGVASKQWAESEKMRDPVADQIDRETFASRIQTQRMEALMEARMRAVGMASGQGQGIG